MQKFKNYINGEFVNSKSGSSFKSIDPSNEKVFAEINLAEEFEVNSAVEAAYKAFHGEWSKILPSKRSQYLRAIGDQLKDKAELLGTIETKDTGKLFKEKKFQANYIAEYYYYYAGLVDKIEGATLPIDKEDASFYYESACWCYCCNYSLEFSDVSNCSKVGTSFSNGQHHSN